MENVTTQCWQWNHPDFRIECDSAIPRDDLDMLVSFLEQSVASGTRYEEGELIELGSMLLRIVRVNDHLKLEEPDLLNIPISWKAGVTQSLRLLRLQKDIVESVGLEGDDLSFSSIRKCLVIGADVSAGVNLFVLERLEAEDSDSGWFIGRLDSQLDYNDETNLRHISVYEAIIDWPRIAGFLALPTGIRIEISSEAIHISLNGKSMEVEKGSLLDRIVAYGLYSPKQC